MPPKLPQITLLFWVMKIAATTLGETAGDHLSKTLRLGYAASSAILLTAFALLLAAQLHARRLIPALFWAVILATSTAGTTISDFMDRTLQLGYAAGSAILIALLAATLTAWRLAEGSLAVDRVRTPRAEAFYWATILASNTLGTALGDYTAELLETRYGEESKLGFMIGAAIFGGLIAALALTYAAARRLRLGSPALFVALFWLAFILTRPFGATLGDVLARPTEEGGINLGTLGSSAVLLTILTAAVLYASRRPPTPQP
jgi:uncharacterized membrane-anchored protein